MKKYIALIRVGIQRELVYRTNFCIGIFSTVLLFIVEVAIWSAVYQGKEEVGSISYNSIMIYTVMTLGSGKYFLQQYHDLHSDDIVASAIIGRRNR